MIAISTILNWLRQLRANHRRANHLHVFEAFRHALERLAPRARGF